MISKRASHGTCARANDRDAHPNKAACQRPFRDILPDLYGRSVMALLAWTQLIRVANLKQRVLSALMLLAETQGSAVRVYLPRQADLAGLLNITRESVGRILGELERDGVVLRIGRNWVDVIQGRADAGGGANRLHDLS